MTCEAGKLSSSFVAKVSALPPDPGMPSGADWVQQLPALLEDCLRHWGLSVEGPQRFGSSAVVLPVRRDDGSPAALKVGWPHRESAHEHLALRAWGGASAVRLLAANPSRGALLLERLDPQHDLDSLGVEDSCRVIGSVLRALDRPALPQLDPLSAHLERLAADLQRARRGEHPGHALPRRLLEQGEAIAAALASDPTADSRLVHTDLHGQNVLRRPLTGAWVAIDPKPMAAVPEMAVAPALWNRWEETVGSTDPRGHLRRRLRLVCEEGGLDPNLARECSLLRMLSQAMWRLRTPVPSTRGQVTVCITVAKAMLSG